MARKKTVQETPKVRIAPSIMDGRLIADLTDLTVFKSPSGRFILAERGRPKFVSNDGKKLTEVRSELILNQKDGLVRYWRIINYHDGTETRCDFHIKDDRLTFLNEPFTKIQHGDEPRAEQVLLISNIRTSTNLFRVDDFYIYTNRTTHNPGRVPTNYIFIGPLQYMQNIEVTGTDSLFSNGNFLELQTKIGNLFIVSKGAEKEYNKKSTWKGHSIERLVLDDFEITFESPQKVSMERKI